MKKPKKHACERTSYCTDRTMNLLYCHLVRDFRSVMGADFKQQHIECLKRDDIKSFRQLSVPDRFQAPPYVFKIEAQLENLFKRYQFREDLYTDKELHDITMEKFDAAQLRVAKALQTPIKMSTYAVVQGARAIVKEILNDYDPALSDTFSRFSTKATVGNTARDAYIDHKLSDPISGSPEHVEWFHNHLRSHEYLASVIRKCQTYDVEPTYSTCESLPLVLVPKSYKSLRPISPNTLIGSYYTYGAGRMLVLALRAIGLDIRNLQSQHRFYAQRASKDRRLVTADLSAASESFSWSTMCRLLPRNWLQWLNRGRLRSYTDDSRTFHYCSFMAMGIGFTFPLQTLLFYALCKSVCNLLDVKGTVSVYGDDLIYPRGAHPYIKSVLTDLGMVLNKDKTFVQSYFRESCGGDFYHGVDVRPYSYEGQCRDLTRRKYEAWLYQLVNGLLSRWTPEDIPETLLFLRSELLEVTSLIKQVPPSYPDYSGWRVEAPIVDPRFGMIPILCHFQNGSRVFKVPHLTQVSRYRYVSFQEAYLYECLRAADAGEVEMQANEPSFSGISFSEWLRRVWAREYTRKESLRETATPVITWLRHPGQPHRYRSSLTKKRLTRLIAATPCNLSSVKYVQRDPDSISDWT